MGDELETFIQEQKAKLAKSRRSHGVISPRREDASRPAVRFSDGAPAHENVPPPGQRRGRSSPPGGPPATQSRPRSLEPQRKAVLQEQPHQGLQLGDHEDRRRQLQLERQADTRAFLSNQKQGGRSHHQTQDDHHTAALPLRDEKSAKAKQRSERNREYNEFLKRKEEEARLKKQSHHPQQQAPPLQTAYQPPVAHPPPVMQPPVIVAPPASYYNQQSQYAHPAADYDEMVRQKQDDERRYRQAGAPNVAPPGGRRVRAADDLEARMQNYDYELAKRKQRMQEEQTNPGQPAPQQFMTDDPSLNFMEPGKYMGGDMFLDDRLMAQFGRRHEDPHMGIPPGADMNPRRADPGRPVPGRNPGIGGPPGGPPDPHYEKKRKQAEYAKDLEAQIHASEAARRIEKEKHLQINLTGDKDPSAMRQAMQFGGASRMPPAAGGGSQNDPRTVPHDASGLPQGYVSGGMMLDRPLDLWGNPGQVPPAFDPNYQYFANADPLDPMVPTRGMMGIDPNNVNVLPQNVYQQELLDQMREKQEREHRNKLEQARWEKKKDEEEVYFPFGKGGAGAPLRDAGGNTIADLRELHHIAETNIQPSVTYDYHGQLTEVTSGRPGDYGGGGGGTGGEAPQFARGRVFNEPMSRHAVNAQEQYKLDLKRQMEERQRQKEEEKRRQAEEDAREEARIKAQMEKIEAEFQKEQEKSRAKQQEEQRRQEEVRQAAENQRLAAERARKEEEEKRANERRAEMERELEERRRAQNKPKSPPLPAQQTQPPPPPSQRPAPQPAPQPKPAPPPPSTRADSEMMTHPVRITKSKPTDREPSRAEVNRQLSAMRQQLLSEQRRIEHQIEHKQDLPLIDITGHVYGINIQSVDAELFRRELDNEKFERSVYTAGRDFRISSTSRQNMLPPIQPLSTESSSSSIASGRSIPPPRPVTTGSKNSNGSSSMTGGGAPKPPRSTTPRNSLFSRGRGSKATSRQATAAAQTEMPYILEEFDLSPHLPVSDSLLEKPSEDKFTVDLLSPQDINRPESETLFGEQQTPVKSESPDSQQVQQKSPDSQMENKENRRSSARGRPTSRTNTVKEDTLVIREASEHANLMGNDHDTTMSTALPIFGNDTTTQVNDTIAEEPEIGRSDSRFLESPDAQEPKPTTESQAYSDDFEPASHRSDTTENGGTNANTTLTEMPPPADRRYNNSTPQSRPQPPKEATYPGVSESMKDDTNLPAPSSMPDLATDLHTPREVSRTPEVTMAPPAIADNEPSVLGTDRVALGYLQQAEAEAQRENPSELPVSSGAVPKKRAQKSVRFFQIIEDDPDRPIELRDFAIPINDRMPARIRHLTEEPSADFEDLGERGHGPYLSSSRLAYIQSKLSNESYRDSLLLSQRTLQGPPGSAMKSSLHMTKPSWIEPEKEMVIHEGEDRSGLRPWQNSFSQKEVQAIKDSFSGKGLLSTRHRNSDMILTEPAKVRRPTKEESWKPIFRDEPNEAALDSFLHSKYDPLTRSRDNFRQTYPNAPQSSDMLEVQQRELIRQQERELYGLRRGLTHHQQTMSNLNHFPDSPGPDSTYLVADTTFLGMNGETLVPTPPLLKKVEKLRDRRKGEEEKPVSPPHNDSIDPRLRDILPSPPSSVGGRRRRPSTDNFHIPRDLDGDVDVTLPFEPFQADRSFVNEEKQLANPDALSLGSNVSFDVEAVARKNRERLKKLQHSNENDGDDDDVSVNDPDEILRKFVDHDSKPKTTRPISGMSEDTEPDWLKPS